MPVNQLSVLHWSMVIFIFAWVNTSVQLSIINEWLNRGHRVAKFEVKRGIGSPRPINALSKTSQLYGPWSKPY